MHCSHSKKPRPSQNNDYRPVALTSLVMTCLERLLLRRISTKTSQFQDPHQFADRRNRSTEDAILTLVHHAQKHLDTPKTSARILFLDFSSAFNTIQPHILLQKLRAMLVNPSLRKWILDFLTNRKQWVKINNTISSTITTNSGAPQGCVSSPALSSVYTSDCRTVDSSITKDHLFKYGDDKTLLGLITENNHHIYESEVQNLVSWCDSNCLQLNTKKTKEMVTDFRKLQYGPPTLSINGEVVERVDSYSYLGVDISNQLDWSLHTKRIQKKCCQRNYFVRKLRKFNVCQTITNLFYKSTVQSVLCYCLICWGGGLSVKNRVLLDRMVRSASKTIGTTLPTVDELYEIYMMKKTRDILKDTSHPLHEFDHVAQCGCQYISERTRTNRYRNTFLPTSVRLLNAQSGRENDWGGENDRGRENDRGGWGDTMGRTIFLTTLHCHYELLLLMSLCYVNIYHKNFLYVGTIKGYCIVLYCYYLGR